jgi:hypothetical protein
MVGRAVGVEQVGDIDIETTFESPSPFVRLACTLLRQRGLSALYPRRGPGFSPGGESPEP